MTGGGHLETAFTLTRMEALERPGQSGPAPIGRQFAEERHFAASIFPALGGWLTSCVGLPRRQLEREQELNLDLCLAMLAPEHSGPG